MMKQIKYGTKKACAGIILLVAFLISLASCLSLILDKPSFVLREITLNPRSLLEMSLVIGVDVKNPNRFDLTLKSFEYTVYLNNEEIGKGRLERELLIPASSTTFVKAPVTANFKNLGGSLKAILTGSDLPYKIEGKAEISAIFGSLTFPFTKEGCLNPKQQEAEKK